MKISTRSMLRIAMFAALCAVGAFIKIPIPPYPVPLTLQTEFLFLAGLSLTKKESFLSQAVYISLGLIGIPVFTGGGGISYVLSPTFGYLLSFLVVAPLLGALYEATMQKGKKALFFAGGFGIIVLEQVIGVAYMALILALYVREPMTSSTAIYLLLIFLPLEIIKLVVALALSKRIKQILGDGQKV